MKMNKRIIVSALAVTMGAGLVGSISGTVAWYQYSTRATIQMMGTSIGVDRNLEVAVTAADVDTAPTNNNAYKSEIGTADILNALNRQEFEFEPLTTTTAYTKDVALGAIVFKSNPVKYKTNIGEWITAKETAYVSYNLWIRATEKNGDGDINLVEKELGLIDAKIANKAVTGKLDISDAVRLSLETADDSAVIANVSSTDLYGPLDLDNEPGNDKAPRYSEIEAVGDDLVYGIDGEAGTTYNLTQTADKTALYAVEEEGTGANAGKYVVKGGIDLGATPTTGAAKIKVTVWLEGWQKLGNPAAAMWDVTKYAGAQFFVGFQIGSGYAREAA